MQFGASHAFARVSVTAKAHAGHAGRPGQRGGSLPYGSEAQGRTLDGVRYFGTPQQAHGYRQTLTPHGGHIVLADKVRGYYVAPAGVASRLAREGYATMPGRQSAVFPVKKAAPDKQFAWAEVYAPQDLDAQLEFMLPDDVERLAYDFIPRLIASGSTGIDLMHNERPVQANVIESFIARRGDLDFTEGAWVLGFHMQDPVIWQAIKAGDFSGLSFQALVRKESVLVTLPEGHRATGNTRAADGHAHAFDVTFDAQGRIASGHTRGGGHTHAIRRAGTTEVAQGHRHLFDIRRPVQVAA